MWDSHQWQLDASQVSHTHVHMTWKDWKGGWPFPPSHHQSIARFGVKLNERWPLKYLRVFCRAALNPNTKTWLKPRNYFCGEKATFCLVEQNKVFVMLTSHPLIHHHKRAHVWAERWNGFCILIDRPPHQVQLKSPVRNGPIDGDWPVSKWQHRARSFGYRCAI